MVIMVFCIRALYTIRGARIHPHTLITQSAQLVFYSKLISIQNVSDIFYIEPLNSQRIATQCALSIKPTPSRQISTDHRIVESNETDLLLSFVSRSIGSLVHLDNANRSNFIHSCAYRL